jgi:hypothetical protein
MSVNVDMRKDAGRFQGPPPHFVLSFCFFPCLREDIKLLVLRDILQIGIYLENVHIEVT